jgi:hypothetical protein
MPLCVDTSEASPSLTLDRVNLHKGKTLAAGSKVGKSTRRK